MSDTLERLGCLYPGNTLLTSYTYGCRCAACVAHWRAYMRDYQRRNRRYKPKAPARYKPRAPVLGPARLRSGTGQYLRITLPGHPLAVGGWVYVHRAMLFAALGEGPHRCDICGEHVQWGYNLEVDHRDRIRENNDLANLRAVCPPCNKRLPRRRRVIDGARLTYVAPSRRW